MHLYCRYLLLLLLTGAMPVRAELTLTNAIAEALARHPELQAERKKIEAASGRALQARLWENPEIEFYTEEAPIHSGGLSQAKNMVGLAQTVPFPGKKSLDDGIGGKEVSAAEWHYRLREIALVRDVKLAFYRVLAARQKLDLTGQLAGVADSTTAVARKRVEAGAAGSQEQLRAEVEQERIGVELANARRAVAETQIALASLVGQRADPVGELPERVGCPLFDRAQERVLAAHPAVLAARAGREKAELELRRARLDPLPDVRLGIAGGRDLAGRETMMEFRVSVPLPIFDRAQGRKREAQAQMQIAQYDIAAIELQLAREWDLLDVRLRASNEQVEAYRARILPKAEAAARLVREGFESGKFTLLDLLDTQRTAFEARLAYLEKLLELNLTVVELEALAGKLNKE